MLRRFPLVFASGFGVAVLYIVAGLGAQLQMYGDASIFAYSVAVEDAWQFHWHNISGRAFSYIFAFVPAEAYVGLTKDARGGIIIYGLLHFSAPLLSLLATRAVDRSPRRTILGWACLSTACVCPLVFGFPTEMWMAHALFWPALALCLYAPATPRATALVFVTLVALVFTHEGAVVFAVAIVATVFLHGRRDAAFVRTIVAFAAAMAIWTGVKLGVRPDDHIAGVLGAAAYKFIDIRNLRDPAFLLLLAAIAGYSVALLLFRRVVSNSAPTYAALVSALLLGIHWLWFDHALLSDARYGLRTALLIATPVFGALAALSAAHDEGGGRSAFPTIVRLVGVIREWANPRMITGAIVLVLLVHAVETAKFIAAWSQYKIAVRALAMGSAADPALGDPRFVSSHRIAAGPNRLAWSSTTPFLSVLLAPDLDPARLVVDPDAGYFWLSCATASRSEKKGTAIPAPARQLIRLHACLNR